MKKWQLIKNIVMAIYCFMFLVSIFTMSIRYEDSQFVFAGVIEFLLCLIIGTLINSKLVEVELFFKARTRYEKK